MTTGVVTKRERWRFYDADAPARLCVIEVEAEPTSGVVLATGEPWRGIHVKARHALLRDRRWHRCNVIGADAGRMHAEIAALAMLHPRNSARPQDRL